MFIERIIFSVRVWWRKISQLGRLYHVSTLRRFRQKQEGLVQGAYYFVSLKEAFNYSLALQNPDWTIVEFLGNNYNIHPSGSEDVAHKIHASYTSCMRSCREDEEKKKEMSKRYMKDCSFLSIAVDSALVRNEHLLSCFVRFSFEERTSQKPLFFAICPSSTGSGQALFVFNKLVEFETPFEKLVSVSTDGASNMIGENIGMIACLKRLIQQLCFTKQTPFIDFHSMWCLAHRLNLTTKDFMEFKGINVVKALTDWFSDRRR